MQAAILSIGDELLIGKITNTNGSYIAKQLTEIGVQVIGERTVRDDRTEIVEALDSFRDKADVVVCTGGLGVTDDDMSKQVISDYFDKKLIISDISMQDVTDWYLQRSMSMPPIAYKFAELPEGCIYLTNKTGIAPGAIIEGDPFTLIMLPGPPREMKPMFAEAADYLKEQIDINYVTRYVKLFGIKEAEVFLRLKDLMTKYAGDILITTYCDIMEVTIAVRYAQGLPADRIDEVMYEIHTRFEQNIFADKNVTLEEVLADYLAVRNIRLAVAESLTGGEICSRLVSIPGVSRNLYEGIVCYDNASKVNRLGVLPGTLNKKGAVSEDTAYEMAQGLLNATDADLVIATTGIAGPSGGSETKPVGLVYIAVGNKNLIDVYKNQFYGDRQEIRECAVKTALFKAITALKNI